MNQILMKIQKQEPKFSEVIKHGFARYDLQAPMAALDSVLHAIVDGYKKEAGNRNGLDYLGYKALTPTEEMENTLIGATNQRVSVDITLSDVKKYLLHFKYDGEDIIKSLYLPAIQNDSSMRISGTKFYLAPVLTEPIISASASGGGLFVIFSKDKLNVRSKQYICSVNGQIEVNDFVYIERFYKLNKLDSLYDRDMLGLETPVVAYILSKYGLEQTVRKYGGGTLGKDIILLNANDPDPAGYDIIASLGKQSPDIKFVYPERHNMRFAVKKKSSVFLYNLAFGLLYIFDAFPKRSLEILKKLGTRQEPKYWAILTGEITFKRAYTHDRNLEAMREHMYRIETYIDPKAETAFAELGIQVKEVYDFIADIVSNYRTYITASKSFSSTVKEKHLEVLYYTMFSTISEINKNLDDLNKQRRRGSLNSKNLQFILKKAFSPRRIFNIAKASKQILPLSLYNTVTDNRIFKVNVMIELQERGVGTLRGSSNNSSKFPASVRKLYGADLFIGNLQYLTKHAPTPRLRLSPFAQFDEFNRPNIPRRLEGVIQEIDRLMTTKSEPTDLSQIDLTIDVIDD